MSGIDAIRAIAEKEWSGSPGSLSIMLHLIRLAGRTVSGCAFTSRRELSRLTGLSERAVRTCLARLEEAGEIKQEATRRFTAIIICNYDAYTGGTPESDPLNDPLSGKEGKALKNKESGPQNGPLRKSINNHKSTAYTGGTPESDPLNDPLSGKEGKSIPLNSLSLSPVPPISISLIPPIIPHKEKNIPEGILKKKTPPMDGTGGVKACENGKKEKGCAEKERKPFDFYRSLVAAGVSEEVAKDWMLVRRKTRAVDSETAFKQVKAELDKAALSGVTPDECIALAVCKSWRGFSFSWYVNAKAKSVQRGRERSGSRDNFLNVNDDWND